MDLERGDEQPTAPALPDTVELPNACVACRYWGGWRFNPPTLSWNGRDLPPINLHEAGRCRRRPPATLAESNGDGVQEPYTRWPLTLGKDWCGEFEATDGRDIVEQISRATAHLKGPGDAE